jgi:8-oxo-dGTP diphosphatase
MEPLDTAADRHLQTQTGVRDVYLEQLFTFGSPRRVSTERLVSVAYYALVPIATLPRVAKSLDRRVAWFSVAELPALLLDHGEIVAMAHRRLAAKLDYSTIALQFMPENFTLRSLQQVYEAILMEHLDKRNFRKRMLGLGCLQDTGHFDRPGPHRPARLYRTKAPGEIQFIR